jgi:hypothetical protein
MHHWTAMTYCVLWRCAVLLSVCLLSSTSTLKGAPMLMMSVFGKKWRRSQAQCITHNPQANASEQAFTFSCSHWFLTMYNDKIERVSDRLYCGNHHDCYYQNDLQRMSGLSEGIVLCHPVCCTHWICIGPIFLQSPDPMTWGLQVVQLLCYPLLREWIVMISQSVSAWL